MCLAHIVFNALYFFVGTHVYRFEFYSVKIPLLCLKAPPDDVLLKAIVSAAHLCTLAIGEGHLIVVVGVGVARSEPESESPRFEVALEYSLRLVGIKGL